MILMVQHDPPLLLSVINFVPDLTDKTRGQRSDSWQHPEIHCLCNNSLDERHSGLEAELAVEVAQRSLNTISVTKNDYIDITVNLAAVGLTLLSTVNFNCQAVSTVQ